MTELANFGATVGDARNLILDTVRDVARVGSPTPRVDDAQVGRWLSEGAADVALAIVGYERLGSSWADVVVLRAKALVELYAAAYLLDATHPERAPTGRAVGDVWRERYKDGLATLKASVNDLVNRLDAQTDTDPRTGRPIRPAAVGAISVRAKSGWENLRF